MKVKWVFLQVVDKIQCPTLISILGNVLLAIGLLLIAPASFIILKPSKLCTKIMMGLLGAGSAIILSSVVGRCFKVAKHLGYEENISNYIMITGNCLCKNIVCIT